eukprot:GHVO01055422.1.p1 GENE.GHVO01055422.1~~GHVO01055422.1.p1  ORF type:complete len:159 (+),score=7.34 GHVO01055422.1:474-950(+)
MLVIVAYKPHIDLKIEINVIILEEVIQDYQHIMSSIHCLAIGIVQSINFVHLTIERAFRCISIRNELAERPSPHPATAAALITPLPSHAPVQSPLRCRMIVIATWHCSLPHHITMATVTMAANGVNFTVVLNSKEDSKYRCLRADLNFDGTCCRLVCL